MIPKELRRDAGGLTRIGRIERADELVAMARAMATQVNEHGGFHWLVDEACDECDSREECGFEQYQDVLFEAAEQYESAGLSLLGERVGLIPMGDVRTAWAKFDEANANTEV